MEMIEKTEIGKKEKEYNVEKWEAASSAAVERYFAEIGTISQDQLDELIKAALTRKVGERYNTASKKSAIADGSESIPTALKDFLASQREDLAALTARILATLEGHPERMTAATKALRGKGDDMRAYLAKFKDED
jgi:hypothetical protein